MANITLSLPERFKAAIKHFSWVNWSDIAREEAMRKEIFERFIAGKLIDEDETFCERTGWDPLDEMKVRGEYVERLKALSKKPAGKPMTTEEFNKWCDSL